MAELTIEHAGAPVLKRVASPVEKVDGKLRHLLDDMAETMYAANGVGLAAPQIGHSIRAVVIDTGDGLLELINPQITERTGTVVDSEGCLSVPEIFGDVERAAEVTVEYTTRFNKRRKKHADGLLARCLQHEIDHLNGVLFIDVAKNLRREKDEKK